MPHALSDDMFGTEDAQAAADDDIIRQILSEETSTGGGGGFSADFMTRDLEVGEKADDAIDYEDIGDDDLAEDEDEVNGEDSHELSGTTVPDAQPFDQEDDDLDDLFGDGMPSSPIQEPTQLDHSLTTSTETLGASQVPIPSTEKPPAPYHSGAHSQPEFRDVSYPPGDEQIKELREYREQQELFATSAQAAKEREDRHRRGLGVDELLPPPATDKELLEQLWPDFEQDKPPRFGQLFPGRRAKFIPKIPLKPPKSLQPNKVTLELAPDQERGFRLPTTSAGTKRLFDEAHNGLISIAPPVEEADSSEDEMEVDEIREDEKIGNVTYSDLKLACVDWRIPGDSSDEEQPDTFNDEWIRNLAGPAVKKQRVGHHSTKSPLAYSMFDYTLPADFDDPLLATSKIAQRILLDMNDPNLLLDIQQPGAEMKRNRSTGVEFKRDVKGSFANPMFKRYNISNDEAYDALKENHQHKVRSTLGHVSVEHSLPALKLQYPFYQVTLSDRELRSFHRPTFTCRAGERAIFTPLRYQKRKLVKHLKPQEVFQKAEDISIGDNSELLLAEYSEEYPITLSNFGMGNKIVNYYRRKDETDSYRPKGEIGEAAILMPQDKSPFSIFGDIEPGQTVPALHNAMYRAPIFKHSPKPTDFLVSRSHTGVHGSKWYMRNLQNLIVVGQEFPSVEVPGTHARKVTEASKKRLKMLSLRLYRKGQQSNAKQPWVSNEMIKHHLPGTEVAQNRSRMREIMTYDRENLTWKPKPGEEVPDEETLRTWIKPEDICLIDSMHAGDRHLKDAGFNKDQISRDEEDDDGQRIELRLAPWHTTKNFLNACQGKAMLELHGEGDPTGRGEGFSMIKVSMKGGFKDIGESIGDKLDAKKLKELGGHSYNVARQQKQYENASARIWKKQAESLSSTIEHSDMEMDVDAVDAEQHTTQGRTPRSEFGTPAAFNRDDDTTSQYSRYSNNDSKNRQLKIKRLVRERDGSMKEEVQVVRDKKVIKDYVRRKREERLMTLTIEDLKPTGNAEFDAEQQLKLKKELARLTRNVERREGREKTKGLQLLTNSPGTPASAGGTKGSGSTSRKCANCGEAGHIKTNKKLCPLLNGQKKQSDTFRDAAAASPVIAPIAQTPSLATSPQ